jgi:hypothetical protein
MTAPVGGLRDISQRLRRLEEAIAAERKLIRPESAGGDCERTRLAGLLAELDQLLKECELTRQA